MASLLTETLELAKLHSFSSGGSQMAAPLADFVKKGINTWPEMVQILQMLSFSMKADDDVDGCWGTIGISPLQGPAPALDVIHLRMQLGCQVADLGEQPGWTAADALKAKGFKQRIQTATQECIDKLPEVMKHRKRLKLTSSVPRWQEPDPDFTIFLAQDAQKNGGNTILAVHLSNLHGLDLRALAPTVLGPADCLPIYRALYGSPAEIQNCVQNFQGKSMILWAPDNGRAVGQVIGVLDKLAKEGSTPFNLHFLVPFTPMPNCPSAEVIGELWSHPLLSSRHAHLRKGVEYFLQPMRCAFSGNTSPLHHLKNLAVITMRSSGPPSPPCLRNFKHQLVEHQMGRAIRIDVPEEEQRGVHILLTQLQMVHCLGWEPGQKSPGGNPATKRAIVVGYFDQQFVSSLDIVGIIRSLRSMPQLRHALIGPESLFGNPHALIMDLGDTRCLQDCSNMINEIVMVSPTRAIITTQHTAGEWEQILTAQFHQDPKTGIKGIKYRLGPFGGRPFAKPGVLAAQADNARARQRLERAPREVRERELLSSSLYIAGLPHTQRATIVQRIISKVGGIIDISGTPSDGEILAPGEWKMGGDSRDGGEIHLQLKDQGDYLKLLSCLHGAGIEVNGHHLSIEVRSIQPMQFAGQSCRSFSDVSSVSVSQGGSSS